MLLQIHSQGIEQKQLLDIINCLEKGGVIIYPTDSVYAFGCKLGNLKASEKLASLKGKKFEKSHFSIICNSISQAAEFTKPISNDIFKILKNNTPGAFTFVFPASTKTPKVVQNKNKTIGIRIPNHPIPLAIVGMLDFPLLTTSLPRDCEELEYCTSPEIIEEKFGDKVDIIINDGICHDEVSTVVDFTSSDIEIIRQGQGELIY